MHIFKLTGQRGETFLAQDRKDPITGDAFAAGDEVVFCAHCRSAFHISSWEYLGGKHCEQEKTLDAFPVQKKLKLVQKTGAQLYPRPEIPEQDTEGGSESSNKNLLKLIMTTLLIPAGIPIFKYGLANEIGLIALLGFAMAAAGGLTILFIVFMGFTDILLFLTALFQSSGEKVRLYEHLISVHPFWWKRKIYRNRELEKLEVLVKKSSSGGDRVVFNFHFHGGGKKRTRLFLALDGELEELLEGLVFLSFHLPVCVASENVSAFYVLEHLREVHQAPLEIVGE